MTTTTANPRRSLRTWASGWVPALGWAGLIFAAAATPDLRFLPDETLDFVVRKIGHMGVFGILALLAWRALAMTRAWRRPWAWASVLAVAYAITDELHQGVVTGRHASAMDVGIDAAGVLIAVGLVRLVVSRRDSGSADPRLLLATRVEMVDRSLHDESLSVHRRFGGGTSFVDRVTLAFAARGGIRRAFAYDADLVRAGLLPTA